MEVVSSSNTSNPSKQFSDLEDSIDSQGVNE